MPLTYRSNDEDLPREFDDKFGETTVLLFDPRLEHSRSSLGNLFRSIDPTERAADVVILRGDRNLLDRVDSDGALRFLLEGTPVYTLVPDPKDPNENHGPQLQPVSWSASDPIGDGAFGSPHDILRELRRAEVNAILLRWDAVWHGDDDIHFELPSGKHADAFIRIAEALADPVDVKRLADWLLPHLADNMTVLGDTGGMLALLLQLKLMAKERFDWNVTIDTLQRYPKARIDIQEVLPSLTPRVDSGGALLFLISVNSSGQLANMVRGLVPADRYHALALCDASSADHPVASVEALAVEPVQRWDVDSDGNCPECENKQKFQIDERNYELVPYVGKAEPVELTLNRAQEHRGFWEAAHRAGAVSLHWNAFHPERNVRHHPVYVDIAKLLGDEKFHEKARAELRKTLDTSQPEVVLVVKHSSTPALRGLLAGALALHPPTAEPPVLEVTGSAFTQTELAVIGPAKRVLILDDAVVTGTTVVRLRKRVYSANQRHSHNAEVALFAVLVRPPQLSVVKRIENVYKTRAGLTIGCAEKLYLPAEGAKNCPWCRERQALRLWGKGLDSQLPLVESRIDRLDAEHLTSPLLLGDTDLHGPLRTEDAFWGTLDEVTAFAAVSASALEVAIGLDKPVTDFTRRYAGLRLIFDTYYDPIIKAAALRTSQRRHIRHAQQDPQFSGWLAQYDETTCTPGLLSELAYAAATTKIPADPVLALFARCSETDHIRLLRQLVELGTGGTTAAQAAADAATEVQGPHG
jgi:hypothetical protein